MFRNRFLIAALALLMFIPRVTLASETGPVGYAGADQVRVIAERASIYVEPRRGSTRIDIVTRGVLLNLLQTNKVNENWYYVSYSSSRYGTRVSGFILESAVERVGQAAPLPPPAPEFEVTIVPTALPGNKLFALTGGAGSPDDYAWRPAVPAVVDIPKETRKNASPPMPQRPPRAIKTPRIPTPRKAPGRMAFGLGYGASYGGAGVCLQVSVGRGIALHAGGGLFPTTLVYSETDWVKNKPLWSVGIKYYLPVKSPSFYPYLDVQYGGLRVEAAQAVIAIWDYNYVYSREQKSLWGPSLLGGVEFRMGRLGFCGALGISYAMTSWEMLQNKVSLSFDFSLIVHIR
jgi:hypothetical protein